MKHHRHQYFQLLLQLIPYVPDSYIPLSESHQTSKPPRNCQPRSSLLFDSMFFLYIGPYQVASARYALLGYLENKNSGLKRRRGTEPTHGVDNSCNYRIVGRTLAFFRLNPPELISTEGIVSFLPFPLFPVIKVLFQARSYPHQAVVTTHAPPSSRLPCANPFFVPFLIGFPERHFFASLFHKG